MNSMIVYDIETLGTYDDSVILSIGAVAFDPAKDFTYDDLLKNSFFTKLSIKDQIALGRKVYKSTLREFWDSQSEFVKKRSLLPSPDDKTASEAIQELSEWLNSVGFNKSTIVWTRGSLDHSATQHLCEVSLSIKCPIPYNQVRDVRTAVDLLAGSSNGYAKVTIDVSKCIKHDPVHDCALDASMIVYYEDKS